MNNDNLFWKLLEPEHPRAEAFCRKLLQNRDEGDDLYQDSVLTALKHLNRLRDNNSFRPWLYRIIIRCYQNRLREPWWRRRATLTQELLDIRQSHNPEDQFTARRWLDIAFKALPKKDRVLIVLHDIEGWKISELSDLFQTRPGTIKVRLLRARGKMRRRLNQFLVGNNGTTSIKEATYALHQGSAVDR